ncbi:MAG: dienelactone hydrolase family protein [Betaproteobacteria bacterium]
MNPFRLLTLFLAATMFSSLSAAQLPDSVSFDSADGKVKLTGYLYLPDAKAWPGPRPAVVMLHGRSGVFSAAAKKFDASTLSSRTVLWGKFWTERGYIGLFVDTFGPRGYAKGFEAGTNNGSRPLEINEITVRPHDAYMGLKFLRLRSDVQKDRVFLQGWSNGGSAALSTMAENTTGMEKPTSETGFRAAIAVYPACTPVTKVYGSNYRTYAPVLLLIGTQDEEVSYPNCEKLAHGSRSGDVEFVRYPGATHSYDTPIPKRTAVIANVDATADTMRRAEAFFSKFKLPAK